MGSFNATCHLSSLLIKEGEDVIIIPVSYNKAYKPAENTIYEDLKSNNKVVGLPLIGKYDGFGAASLNNVSKDACDVLRNEINKRLINNESVRKEKKSQRFDFSESYLIFKDSKDSDAMNGSFINDVEAEIMFKDESKYCSEDIIKTNENLLNLMYSGSIFVKHHNSISRIGFLMIKKSIYDELERDNYSESVAEMKLQFKDLLSKDFDKEEMNNISPDGLNRILKRYNMCNYLINKVATRLDSKIFKNESFTDKDFESLDLMIILSIIENVYKAIGKSYYPNVSKLGSNEILRELNDLTLKEIDQKRSENIEQWSVKNGYCEDEAGRQEWFDFVDND